jgi:hypothetical protein
VIILEGLEKRDDRMGTRGGSYRDAGRHGGYGVEADVPVLKELREHLVRLGERSLEEGDVLAIDVLDIDRAGRYEPWRAAGYDDVRIMRDVTWPGSSSDTRWSKAAPRSSRVKR